MWPEKLYSWILKVVSPWYPQQTSGHPLHNILSLQSNNQSVKECLNLLHLATICDQHKCKYFENNRTQTKIVMLQQVYIKISYVSINEHSTRMTYRVLHSALTWCQSGVCLNNSVVNVLPHIWLFYFGMKPSLCKYPNSCCINRSYFKIEIG